MLCTTLHRLPCRLPSSFRLLSTSSPPSTSPTSSSSSPNPILKYIGPFSSLTHRLKRVSLLTATFGISLPITSLLTSSTVPAIGQIAVTGTALTTAVGSTLLLNYCVSPYVHKLEKVNENDYSAVTVNMFAQKMSTTFTLDQIELSDSLNRPFCNFIANGMPMYVHGELLNDKKLLKSLMKRNLTKSEIEGRSDDENVED
ncbi:hypothetical protein TL16_g08522, partial [Triparma laevis f. inornata]|uniref:Uncharacterized protein n=2 Tax=Triparma laevis TaxID=1534972 RepID=A0A9W7E7G5_9STRA